MKTSINTKLIKRNKKIAQITLYGSLALLTIGFVWTIRNPEPSKTYFGYFILIPAYLLVQISIYMSNRWGKSPRPDEIVAQALKGLDDKFTLYSYTTAVPHLLLGPIGVWIINPYHHSGEISYDPDKQRYLQKGGPNFISKHFSQEGLPNIKKDVAGLKKEFIAYLEKKSIQYDEDLKVINLFYSENAVLKTSNAPEINLKSEKLKDFVRKYLKTTRVPEKIIVQMQKYMPSVD
ncbi:MAG: hypothetical protein MUP85_20385 [Candidatus Lokiarchaeota archaeon]|nr:hypothetical protein [Candidatus Lokiarchaeota archaeon]